VVRDNWYAHADLRNGQTGTVLSVQPAAGSATFRRDLDREVIQLPRRYLDRNVDHAYAQTIHTAQGQTFRTTHVYVDTGVRAEHGYTALSRAREETHLWVNDAPGPLGECTYILGDPLTDDRVASLARQLSQSVIERPAHDQGLSVASASDRELIEWRDELEGIIRRSPIAADPTDRLVALDAAIAEARETAERIGTSGSHAQVEHLEAQRNGVIELSAERENWVDGNAPVLHRYSVVSEEIQHRINARVAGYEVSPPDDLIAALGRGPAAKDEPRTLHAYAEARLVVGPDADLSDPAVLAGAGWRKAVTNSQDLREPPTERISVLRAI